MSEDATYIDVILPINIPQPLTYLLPLDLAHKAKLGLRALVRLGNTKYCSAIIVKIHNNVPTAFVVKPIEDILDESPLFDVEKQQKFFYWVSQYYMSNIGEVLQSGLPSALKITSETKISIHPEFDGDISEISDEESQVLEFISKSSKDLTLSEIKKVIVSKNLFKILDKLYTKAIIVIYEEPKDKNIPKLAKFIYLNKTYLEQEKLKDLYQQLEKKPKQLDILLFFQSHAILEHGNLRLELSKFDFESLSKSSLKTLLEKSVFLKKIIKIERFPKCLGLLESLPTLSSFQNQAYERLKQTIVDNVVTLFYGVHNSGKTTIQLHLLSDILQKNQQILYLVPEIAFSEYLINQLRKYFGDRVLAYNSKYSDQERAEVWKKVVSGDSVVIIAVRNGVFLPFKNLGMIIVDSEHEESYKQSERSPRYNARDSSIILGKIHNAPVILFSATPSVEIFYIAQEKKIGVVTLSEIYENFTKESIYLKNFSQAAREKRVREEFIVELLEEIRERIARGEKALIFQSKKGYAPYVSCKSCAAVPSCINCNVSLTYHQFFNTLKCHYCGYRQSMIISCKECGSSIIKNVGYGTEKLEESLIDIFPDKVILRFDSETTKSKRALLKLIDQIEGAKADIFLGTQILAKGFNFSNVGLAAIMQIDHILNSQDFRAHERGFQIVSYICAKAKFGPRPIGFVQTNNTKHFILQCASRHDYIGFYENEIRLRRKNSYPPFANIIKISFLHKIQSYPESAADLLYQFLLPYAKQIFVSAPVAPIINRIRNEYILDIWIKIPKNAQNSLGEYKQIIQQKIENCKKIDKKFRSVKIIIDVDV